MKQSDAERFFTQKKWTVAELICLVLAVIGFVARSFLPGFYFYGSGMFAVCVILLIIFKLSKAKGSDVEAALEKLLQKEVGEHDPKLTLEGYDLSAAPILRGREAKLYTPIYTVAVFDFSKEGTQITKWTVDLIASSVEKESYCLTDASAGSLEELTVSFPGGKKTVKELILPSLGMRIPVSSDDIYSEELIGRVCKRV